jgi:hypothetical protein
VQGGYTNPLRKRLGGDVLYDADTSKQVSLKDALHLLAKLGKPGTLVSDGRRSCAKRQMWNCLVHTSMGVFLIEICDTSHWRRTRMPAWWGDWGAGKKVLHDFAVRVTSQLISIGAAERCWKAYAHIHCECPKRTRNRLGPERAPKLVRVHYNLRLRRKRSSPEYDDMHLPAMTIDPIEEAADDLLVEDDSD